MKRSDVITIVLVAAIGLIASYFGLNLIDINQSMWVNYYCSRVLRIVVRGSQSGFQLNRIPPDDQAERTPFLPGDPLSGIPRALFLDLKFSPCKTANM